VGALEQQPYAEGTGSSPLAVNAFSRDPDYYRRAFDADDKRPDEAPVGNASSPWAIFRLGNKKPAPFVKADDGAKHE